MCRFNVLWSSTSVIIVVRITLSIWSTLRKQNQKIWTQLNQNRQCCKKMSIQYINFNIYIHNHIMSVYELLICLVNMNLIRIIVMIYLKLLVYDEISKMICTYKQMNLFFFVTRWWQLWWRWWSNKKKPTTALNRKPSNKKKNDHIII